MVSVHSAQQRHVVLNIIGPPAWNSDPVGFHVMWDAVSDRRGPQGEMSVPLPPEWSPVENTINVTLTLPGGHDYRLSVSALGADGAGNDLWGSAVDVDVTLPLGESKVQRTYIYKCGICILPSSIRLDQIIV